MKRRNFLKGSALVTGAALSGQAMASTSGTSKENQIYELRVYRMKGRGRNKLDEFYKNAFIPALNAAGVKVGAFGEYSQTEPPAIYYLLVYESLEMYQQVKNDLWKDEKFLEKAKSYFDSTSDNPVYKRFETYLLEAFDVIPQIRIPGEERGLFELRTYDSGNEEAGQRKIKMFNKEELALFDKVGLNPCFFGEILAGPEMPALVYMLWFKDMDERNERWGKFGGHPDWLEMRDRPEYANAITVVNKVFLVPLDYSQI